MSIHSVYKEPGERVAGKDEFLRGHGTRLNGRDLVASTAGFVEKTSKLLSVLPVRSRYQPSAGHVVVGRIVEVCDKRWKVDCNSCQHATLDISAIHLPGSVQRRRTKEDQLQMRDFFVEGDLLSAEVQQVKSDGGFALHMRNLKYGKLVTGVLVKVQQSLVRHLKSHMIDLPNGVHLVLGHNGMIWVTASRNQAEQRRYEELAEFYQQKTVSISNEIRHEIVRIRNCIDLLNRSFLSISVCTILLAYERSLELNIRTSQILHKENVTLISTYVESNQRLVKERQIIERIKNERS